MKLLHASKTRALFSEDAEFGDCHGKTESLRQSCLTLVWTEYRAVRAAVGCAGKHTSLLQHFLEGHAVGARAREVFEFPQRWLALSAEHKKNFRFSCGKVKASEK